MQYTLQELVDDVLALEPIEAGVFRGRSPAMRFQRVFGGQVASQAMVAAGLTVPPERQVHSLHAYFLRPGDPSVPILYRVEKVRDGRSFSARRVTATQRESAIFVMSASFHEPEEGYEHQSAMPETVEPEDSPSREDLLAAFGQRVPEEWSTAWPIEVRYASGSPWEPRPGRAPHQQVWVRARGSLPWDQLLHVAIAIFASDMTVLDPVLFPHGASFDSYIPSPTVQAASLDHAMWFHRPFRADEWLLYSLESPNAGGGRGLAGGRFYTQDGTLVASVVQEGLIRPDVRPSDLASSPIS